MFALKVRPVSDAVSKPTVVEFNILTTAALLTYDLLPFQLL